MQYAGGGARLLAAIIDNIILVLVGFVLGFVIGMVMGKSGQILSTILSLVISIYYWVFYQASSGQTLGKKAMGIKVVDMAGNKPSAMTFFLREIIGKLVSAIILFIGYLMILWDGKKQGLHDKIAGTVVVRVANMPAQSPAANTTSTAV
ncbi:MAG: RDD family protein [Patescibacteria group bacterium]